MKSSNPAEDSNHASLWAIYAHSTTRLSTIFTCIVTEYSKSDVSPNRHTLYAPAQETISLAGKFDLLSRLSDYLSVTKNQQVLEFEEECISIRDCLLHWSRTAWGVPPGSEASVNVVLSSLVNIAKELDGRNSKLRQIAMNLHGVTNSSNERSIDMKYFVTLTMLNRWIGKGDRYAHAIKKKYGEHWPQRVVGPDRRQHWYLLWELFAVYKKYDSSIKLVEALQPEGLKPVTDSFQRIDLAQTALRGPSSAHESGNKKKTPKNI